MRVANVLAGLAVLLWTALFFAGLDLAGGVADRHVLGYPNTGQLQYYVAVPGSAAIALLACAWVFNGLRRWPWILALVSSAALLALLPYLLIYGGGV